MSASFDLKSIWKRQAEKYEAHKVKQQEENVKHEKEMKEIENKLRLENEAKIIQEIQLYEDFEEFILKIETIIFQINNANDIIEIDGCLISLISLIEISTIYFENEQMKKEISDKLFNIVNSISQNINSKFDITVRDMRFEASLRIIQNIKKILEMIGCNDIDVQLMDTSNDEQIATDLNLNTFDTSHDEEIARQLSDNPFFGKNNNHYIGASNFRKKYNSNNIMKFQNEDQYMMNMSQYQNDLIDDSNDIDYFL
jgi:hypothetical protein